MYPAIRDGDLAIMFKLEEYKINEVVAYESDGEVKLGRIVGMPGSEISYDEGGFMVDGIYPAEQVFYPTEFDEDFEMPYYIDEDHYFIMNDFRSDKNDSRTFGAVEKNKLKGKLIYLFRRRGF
jgi:signal peptidase I